MTGPNCRRTEHPCAHFPNATTVARSQRCPSTSATAVPQPIEFGVSSASLGFPIRLGQGRSLTSGTRCPLPPCGSLSGSLDPRESGQHRRPPTSGDLRGYPATAALPGSHSSPLGVRITPWPARVRPGLNTDAFGSLTPPQSGIERRSEPRRRHRDRRCGYEGRRDVALDGSRRGGRYSTRARRRCRFGSEVTH